MFVILRIQVVWNMTLCCWLRASRRFEGCSACSSGLESFKKDPAVDAVGITFPSECREAQMQQDGFTVQNKATVETLNLALLVK
jgi:hypothetical protein